MLNKTHLVSAHLDYSLSERLNLGISANSVQHERQGQYLNLMNDPYSLTEERDWFSFAL